MLLFKNSSVLPIFMAVISLAFAKHKDKPSTSDADDTELVVASTVRNTISDHPDTNSKY